jgi:hypothetical protein
MNAAAILTVSAAVVACTQLLKWAILPDRYGPIAVLGIALAGVTFWVWTQGTFLRVEAFEYFAAWIAIATSAAGVYGFTRASGEALTKALPPPGEGAGSDRTLKS